MNLLTMKNIHKSYTDKVLLDGVDFSLATGEKVGVVGINGTGKSTLLRLIAGVDEIDAGEYAKGNNLRIAYLTQDMSFPAGVTLYDYVSEGREQGRVQQMLGQLDFPDVTLRMEELSGGQRKKAMLARTLLTECDVLVLDEPTNHLDQEIILWLEQYLQRMTTALVMVTHDRYFLDRVCNRIIEVDKGQLYSYQANYTGFLEAKQAREEMAASTYKKHQNILRKELAWVRRGAKARSTKQKARLDRYEVLKNEKAPETSQNVEMSSGYTRMGRKTLELSHIGKSFGQRQVIADFSYIFLKNDRIGIVGHNGCGKSTLMNIIAGTMAADQGEREVGQTIRIGYFSQENERLDPSQKVIDYIRDTAEYLQVGDETISASAMLERFLFEGALQYARIEKLSGGEKRRLYLLKVLMEAPNVLLLDEPTNDLDIQTLAILEDYLDDFAGIVVAVSHDRYFLDRMASRVFAFEEGGIIVQSEGNFSDYYESRKERMRPAEKMSANETQSGQTRQTKERTDGRTHENRLKFTYKEQKEYETIESDIEALENRIAAIDSEMLTCATDFVKLRTLSEEKEAKELELDEKMERYLYLSDLEERIRNQ